MNLKKNNSDRSFGVIYKATNTLTSEAYIGATTYSVQQRQWDHTERANRGEKGKFYEAIRTYGEEAFEWEQIDTANTPNELASKEKEYIIEYNSQEGGYNTNTGGEIQKLVYQYNVYTHKLIKVYHSLSEAAEAIGSTKKAISKACLGVIKTHKDSLWSYERPEVFKPIRDARKRPVGQYTLEGKLIDQFESVAEASRQTGVYKSCIAKVCRGERKQTGGFKWRYI